jgi:hypothetical protein
MSLIAENKKAVLYLDILGMSVLTTQPDFTPGEECYNSWFSNRPDKYENTPQYLAAAILLKFREILNQVQEGDCITIAQLSDGAFVWSSDITALLRFAANFMNNAIQNGILCRGGLAYGKVIDTGVDATVGRFIVGEAVTRAVGLEKAGAKGARILADDQTKNGLCEQNANLINESASLFVNITNPLDYSNHNEFRWYICKADIQKNDTDWILVNNCLAEKTQTLKHLIDNCHKFDWNKRGKGKEHFDSTIKAVCGAAQG